MTSNSLRDSAVSATSPNIDKQAERVLVVEDDLELLSEISEAIELAGFQVTTAATAEAAVSAVHRDSYISTIVTDIMLGDISGIELMRKLSRMRRATKLRFIVISGHTTVDHTLSALRLGAMDFISKPIVIDELIDSLKRASLQAEPSKPLPKQLSEAEAADLLLLAQKQRAKIFGHETFDDPAWNMLLDLYASTLRGRATSVKDLCIASGSTNTTALRRLSRLHELQLIERVRDEGDHRRVLVKPTDAGMRAMSEFSEWLTKRSVD